MRPEHSETKAKTETIEQETEIETETVKVTKIGMFAFYYTREVKDEPEMDFAFKMISK